MSKLPDDIDERSYDTGYQAALEDVRKGLRRLEEVDCGEGYGYVHMDNTSDEITLDATWTVDRFVDSCIKGSELPPVEHPTPLPSRRMSKKSEDIFKKGDEAIAKMNDLLGKLRR